MTAGGALGRSGGLLEAVPRADEHRAVLEPQHVAGEAQREAQDLVEVERRTERGARHGEDFLDVVGLAAEDDVDQPLHPLAHVGQHEQHPEGEGEREGARMAEW